MPLIAESSEQDYIHGGTQQDVYSEDDVVRVPCPLCGCERGTLLYTEHEVIGISRCSECSLVYTSPRLVAPEQIYHGDRALYYAEARLIFEGKATHHRDPNYLAEIRQIERHKTKGRLLDVGCNMGMLLRLARERGWETVGVEPSPSLAELAMKWGFRVHNCYLNELPSTEEGSFDVVALSDVFEHISDPKPFLGVAQRLLAEDGLLYVKVPNARWNLLKQKGLTLAGRRPTKGLWDSYEHVVHYSDETLRRMLTEAGFTVLRIATDPPVQTPNWHEYVGHYYQYPTPWLMDWRRKLIRYTCYRLATLERLLRFGKLGYLAQNIVAVARKSAPAPTQDDHAVTGGER